MPMQAARDPPGQSPAGLGLGGSGTGDGTGTGTGTGIGTGGGLQSLGSGPWTTLPVTFKFLTVYCEDPRSPVPQSPGTQPCHCEEYITAPFDFIALVCPFPV